MLFLTTALALSGCEYFRTRTPQDFMRNPFEPSAAEYEQMAREMNPAALRAPSSVVVCRSHQCAPANYQCPKNTFTTACSTSLTTIITKSAGMPGRPLFAHLP